MNAIALTRWFLAGVLLLTASRCLLGEDAPALDRLIERLGGDDAAQRKEAAKQLEKLGRPALDALRQAMKAHPDPDVRLRAGVLVRALTDGGRGELRAIVGGSGYWINRVRFLPDGKRALAAGGGVILYDLETGKELQRTLELQFARPGLCVLNDGKHFLTSHQNDKSVRLGEVASGKEVRAFEGHTAGVFAVALSPDSELAATGGEDGTLRIWDVASGKQLRQCKDVPSPVRCLAFSPDGGTIVSGHHGAKADFKVRLWNTATGKEEGSFAGHTKDVTALAFLPDGKAVLSASMDGTLRLWEIGTARELRKMEHKSGATDVALSPDGKQALSAGYEDKAVRLWNLEDGRELFAFSGHVGRVLSVAFAPDGTRALSGDSNGTLRLWRVAP